MATSTGEGDDVALPFEFRVAGTGHDRRYSAIRKYAAKRSVVRLLPEPHNAYDPHAIGVHMAWLNAAKREIWELIGYVPAELSETIGQLIGTGEWAIESAYIRRLDASPELDSPKVFVRLEGRDLRDSSSTDKGKP